MQDVLTEVDYEFGQKSFLCSRVFSKKQKDLVRFKTLENFAQAGKLLPIPSLISTYPKRATKPKSPRED